VNLQARTGLEEIDSDEAEDAAAADAVGGDVVAAEDAHVGTKDEILTRCGARRPAQVCERHVALEVRDRARLDVEAAEPQEARTGCKEVKAAAGDREWLVLGTGTGSCDDEQEEDEDAARHCETER